MGVKSRTEPAILVLIVIVGALIGSLLWSLVTPYLPELFAKSITVGTTGTPFILELGVVTLTLGIVLSLNIGSILGMIGAFLIYRKL